MTRRLALGLLVAAAGAAACTEQLIAPGNCPEFCPNGQLVLVDTIFTTIIQRDSAHRGYMQPYRAVAATAADVPGVQSRPYFKLDAMITRVKNPGTDTSTVPIFADSARLRVTIIRKDTVAPNLRVQLYALPSTVDTTSTFADLDPYFSGPIVDSVNVSDLLTRPLIDDSATKANWQGNPIRTDSAGHVLVISSLDSAYQLYFSLDTLQAPLSVADSGRLAYGVKVVADTAVSVGLATNESAGNNGTVMQWFFHFTYKDSTTARDSTLPRAPSFDSFVFDPPNPPLDSNLAVGGAPSARSLIRVEVPEFLHDSVDIVRATLILVPTAPVPGVASDSFHIIVWPVQTDLGAKSPIERDATGSQVVGGDVVIHPGTTDTVRVEITDMVRSWSVLDTLAKTAFLLEQFPQAASFTEIRFYSSRAAAFRPALHVTYIKRYPFGEP